MSGCGRVYLYPHVKVVSLVSRASFLTFFIPSYPSINHPCGVAVNQQQQQQLQQQEEEGVCIYSSKRKHDTHKTRHILNFCPCTFVKHIFNVRLQYAASYVDNAAIENTQKFKNAICLLKIIV
jgi:hypothetical protein